MMRYDKTYKLTFGLRWDAWCGRADVQGTSGLLDLAGVAVTSLAATADHTQPVIGIAAT
jgi:hypothetical protein